MVVGSSPTVGEHSFFSFAHTVYICIPGYFFFSPHTVHLCKGTRLLRHPLLKLFLTLHATELRIEIFSNVGIKCKSNYLGLR